MKTSSVRGEYRNIRLKYPKLVLCFAMAAGVLAGCGDDNSDNHSEDVVTCSGESDCAGREDGKTHCDTVAFVCVTPSAPSKAQCGNGVVESGEQCDLSNLNEKTCANWSDYLGGVLTCNAMCEFDKSGCFECTENDLGKCDNGQKCSNGHCVDANHVVVCGDNLVEGDEDCDGSNYNGKTCADQQGYVAGTLSCEECVFDTSGCVECNDERKCADDKVCSNGICVERDPDCGDGYLDAGESCDSDDLNGKTCTSYSEYIGGTLKCNASCEFDKSGCFECTDSDANSCGSGKKCSNGHCVNEDHVVQCGDGIVESGEACDTDNLNGKTCADMNEFVAGELKCSACAFDTASCFECTEDKHCAKHTDGKTQCDNHVCVKPSVTVGSDIVISQIYPGGGNDGSVYKTSYVELFNRGSKEVNVKNWSIQYGAASKSAISSVCIIAQKAPIPAGGYYLVAIRSGKTGIDIPKADFTCSTSINSSAESGKFILVNNSTKLSTSSPESGYVDAIGYGSANWAEGGAPAGKLEKTRAELRNHGGCDDTDNNKADFTVQIAVPRNSSSPHRDCSAAYTTENCTDKLDNDGDSLTDCADPDCQSQSVCNNAESSADACKDRIDNDGDGTVDCYDTGCQKQDFCQSVISENDDVSCSDKVDNDGDGKKDCDDPDCQSLEVCKTITPENDPTTCSDKKDNDGDGKTDCDDTDCKSLDVCKTTEPENDPTTCSDKKDNDGDGKTDCDDTDCKSLDVCKTTEPENDPTTCSDKKDNDGDGKIDCDDPDCSSFCGSHECNKNQTYVAKYDICAYNIKDKADLILLANTWNSSGADTYQIEGKTQVGFILTNNIDLAGQEWTSIGTKNNFKNVIFIGNGKTISGILQGGALFDNLSDTTIDDLTIKLGNGKDDYISLGNSGNNVVLNRVSILDDTSIGNVSGTVFDKCLACTFNDFTYSGTTEGTSKIKGGIINEGSGTFDHAKINVVVKPKNFTSGYLGGLIAKVTGNNVSITDSEISTDISFDYYTTSHDYGAMCVSGLISDGRTVTIKNSKIHVVSNIMLNKRMERYTSYVYFGGIDGYSKGELNIDQVELDLDARLILNGESYHRYIAYMGGLIGLHENALSPGANINRLKLVVKNLDSANDVIYSDFYKKHHKGLLFGVTANSVITNSSIRFTDDSVAEPYPYTIYSANNVTFANVNQMVETEASVKVVNTLKSSVFTTSRLDEISGDITATGTGNISKFDHIVYTKREDSDFYTFQACYPFSSDADTVSRMNKSLSSGNDLFPKGKYLPWYVNGDGKADLKFDASESEMYSIP